MHTVALTHVFERAAADAGMSEDEIQVLVDFLAVNPTAGDAMAGTGECRKVRVAGLHGRELARVPDHRVRERREVELVEVRE